jgi:superfamily II DNA or RNA helicase
LILDGVITLREEELTPKQWKNLLPALRVRDRSGNVLEAFDHRADVGKVVIPRGALDLLNVPLQIDDRRSRPVLPKLRHVKELDANDFTGQRDAVKMMVEKEQGQLRMGTGSGKTTVGVAFAAACGTRTLVYAHTRAIMQQWIDRAREEVPGIEVGTIQGDNCSIGHITVAMVQTIVQRYLDAGPEFWDQFGALIVDEAHHAAALGQEVAINACPAYYRFGFTASEKRSDGLMPLVRFNVGPVIYKQKFKPQVEIKVRPIKSNFHSRYNATRWTKLVAELVNDDERNKMIADLIAKEAERETACVLVLSRQISHLEKIAEHLPDSLSGHYAIVTGQLSQRRQRDYLEAMRLGDLRVVLGTQLFEEGVDVPRIDRVVFAYPGTDITTLQKVGRGARKFDGKRETVVLDIVDANVAVLVRQWDERRTWYRSTGTIEVGKMEQHDEGRVTNGVEKEQGGKLLAALREAVGRGSRAAR